MPSSFCFLKNHDNSGLGGCSMGTWSVFRTLSPRSHRVETRDPESCLLSVPCHPGLHICAGMVLPSGWKNVGVLSNTREEREK